MASIGSGIIDVEQHQVRRCAGGNLQGHLAV